MATNIKQIIYFHPRLDAAAAAIRSRRSDIDMFRRDFGGPAADNWAEMGRAHGYHACARTEMREPWFPDARLIAKAPNLLAVCSLGAGLRRDRRRRLHQGGDPGLQPVRRQQGGGGRARRGPHARHLQEDHGDRPGDAEGEQYRALPLYRHRAARQDDRHHRSRQYRLSCRRDLQKRLPHDRARLRPLSLQGENGGAQRREGRAEGDSCSAPTTSPCTARGRRRRSA